MQEPTGISLLEISELTKSVLSSNIQNVTLVHPDTITLSDSLPYANESHDAVISRNIVGKLSRDAIKFHIEEAYRILRPNGAIIIYSINLQAISHHHMLSTDSWFMEAKDKLNLDETEINDIYTKLVAMSGGWKRKDLLSILESFDIPVEPTAAFDEMHDLELRIYFKPKEIEK